MLMNQLLACITFVLCIFFSVHAEQFIPGSKLDHDENPRAKVGTVSPVILVPGLGGNKLHAKLNKPTKPHWYCSKTSDWYDLWLDATQLIPFRINCWMDNIKLYYNYESRTTRNTDGVELKASDFGRTETVEDIDTGIGSSLHSLGKYYSHIVEALVKRGYVRHHSIFGAPYDFRKGPNETKDWFVKLKNLAECAYQTNDKTGVTFIVHSMGARMILYFLQMMTQEWKDQYVKQVISLCGAWGGSMKAVQAVSIGYDLGSNLLDSGKLKPLLQTFPSIVWLMPSPDFWKPDEVIVTMKNTKYTIQNIDQFFHDIGVENTVKMRKDLVSFNNFTAPGVEMHCLYGHIENSIVEGLHFGESFNPAPTIENGHGDKSVNIRSLRGCERWENSQAQGKHAIYQQELQGIEHFDILKDSKAIDYIVKKLTGYRDYPRFDELELERESIMKIRLI